MKWILGVALALAAAGPASAQDDTAVAALERNRLDIEEAVGGGYRGAGWEQLLRDGAAAQFLLIGEQHGTADIPIFAQALHKALAINGYSHAAYEIGPYSTDRAEHLIRSGRGALAAYIRRPGYSFVLPFLFFDEEVSLAEQIVAMSPDQDALWGLDQEFVGAAPIAVELLRSWSETEAQRSAVASFAAKTASNPLLIGSLGDQDLVPLETAFAGNKAATDLVAALRLSSEIYAPFVTRSDSIYPANLRRENYMKSNFASRFSEAEERIGRPPKVFMKFGGNHAMRGFTSSDVPGFGNFLAEWGVPRGFALLNMMIDCEGGEVREPRSNRRHPCESYFGSDSALKAVRKAGKMTLIDLRPLRPRLQRLKGLDARTRQLILAFDYYLVIRDVAAATSVAAPPTK